MIDLVRFFGDHGGPLALYRFYLPFYCAVFGHRESEHCPIFHYRVGYVFGVRIFKWQVALPNPEDE